MILLTGRKWKANWVMRSWLLITLAAAPIGSQAEETVYYSAAEDANEVFKFHRIVEGRREPFDLNIPLNFSVFDLELDIAGNVFDAIDPLDEHVVGYLRLNGEVLRTRTEVFGVEIGPRGEILYSTRDLVYELGETPEMDLVRYAGPAGMTIVAFGANTDDSLIVAITKDAGLEQHLLLVKEGVISRLDDCVVGGENFDEIHDIAVGKDGSIYFDLNEFDMLGQLMAGRVHRLGPDRSCNVVYTAPDGYGVYGVELGNDGALYAAVDLEDMRGAVVRDGIEMCSAYIVNTVAVPKEWLVGPFLHPGDCNQDGKLDISDGLCLLGHLFLGAPAVLPCGNGTKDDPGNRALLDWNVDTITDISDAVALLSWLFLGGPPHALGIECRPISGCPTACSK